MTHADLIITNAHVFTANPAQPHAEAVAVAGQHITCVGSKAEAEAQRGPNTRHIDGQGGSLLPGFIDSHFHLLHGSLMLGDIQLGQVNSLDSLAETIIDVVRQQPYTPWLVAQGLRYNALPNQTLTRRQLDAIIPDRPLIILAYDLHTAWANTAALQQAGLLRDTPDIGPNSKIIRDADGLATGKLVEPGAYNHIFNLIPSPTPDRKKELLRRGLAYLARLGITSVHNMDGNAQQMALYTDLEAADQLSLRVYLPFDVKPDTPAQAMDEAVAMHRQSTPFVRGGAVKFFMDGVLETYTGLLLEDYADRPGVRGGALFSAARFNRLATHADRLGLQIFVHACGDGAVRRTLDGFEAARLANGRRDSRHRVENIELINPADVSRFADLDVIASMQPTHAILTVNDPDPWPARVGPERWPHSFAWQTLRQANARLVFGSGWPVAPPNPLLGIYFARNRQPWAAGLPHQRQSLAETLHSYTRHAAYAEFQEQHKGQLRPGYLADMVLLSANLETTPAPEIQQVHPRLTVVDGRIVFEA